MTEPCAVSGNLARYQTMADGTLRIVIDLREDESVNFHRIFPTVNCAVAIARLGTPDGKPVGQWGDKAKILRASKFTTHPEVWRACGTDAQFLAWVRTQKCVARSDLPHSDVSHAAHVWRLEFGFGKGLKGEYAAVKMCSTHHQQQHSQGETAVGGRAYLEGKLHDTRTEWVWHAIKRDLRVESMRDADPADVYEWARERGVEGFLPRDYFNPEALRLPENT